VAELESQNRTETHGWDSQAKHEPERLAVRSRRSQQSEGTRAAAPLYAAALYMCGSLGMAQRYRDQGQLGQPRPRDSALDRPSLPRLSNCFNQFNILRAHWHSDARNRLSECGRGASSAPILATWRCRPGRKPVLFRNSLGIFERKHTLPNWPAQV